MIHVVWGGGNLHGDFPWFTALFAGSKSKFKGLLRFLGFISLLILGKYQPTSSPFAGICNTSFRLCFRWCLRRCFRGCFIQQERAGDSRPSWNSQSDHMHSSMIFRYTDRPIIKIHEAMKHILCRYVTGTAGRGRSCRVANLLWWAPNGALLAILRESKSNMKKYGEKKTATR